MIAAASAQHFTSDTESETMARQSGQPSGGGAQQQQPFATASVGEGSGEPSGYMWDLLKKAKTPAEVRKVREFAKQHGYSPDGQLMQAIADRLSEG